jgi:hypothetical protein
MFPLAFLQKNVKRTPNKFNSRANIELYQLENVD